MMSEATQAEVQETFDYLVGEASKVLELGGSFVPFGAGIRADGERTHVQVELSVDDSHPNDHIAGLVSGFREEAGTGKLVAAGLAFDGAMADDGGESGEALVIHIEHIEGDGVQIFLPYRRLPDGPTKLIFSPPIVQSIEPEIFTQH